MIPAGSFSRDGQMEFPDKLWCEYALDNRPISFGAAEKVAAAVITT